MARNIRLRLYRVHDYDLYTLYYDPHFRFTKAVREVLSAYATGDPDPVIDVSQVQRLVKGMPFSKVVTVSIPDEDEDVIRMLEALFSNGRNGNHFIKSLLRRCMIGLDAIYFPSSLREEFKDTKTGTMNNDLLTKKSKKRAALSENEKSVAAERNDSKDSFRDTKTSTSESAHNSDANQSDEVINMISSIIPNF